MGGLKINCPLCCDKTFDSKQGLLEHLASISGILYCPICNSQCSSLLALTAHLSLYDCQTTDTTQSNIVMYDQQSMRVVNIEYSEDNINSDDKSITDELNSTAESTNYITDQTYNTDDGKMYADLLGKQLSKPLASQEIKLMKEDGDSYMIITQEENELGEDSAVVTKLNNDGTVSLTTIKDMKIETDTLIAPEPDSGSQEEIYSCNACRVSFTSVIDHIQNYHNDQEVVLEDIPSTVEPESTESPVDQELLEEEDYPASDKLAPRRVITDTGNIVEEPIILKTESIASPQKAIGKADMYHKVITKEVKTKTGFTMKMYSCVLCNMSVSNLSDLKTHPCQLKMKYPCPHCPATYESSRSFFAHMKIHKQKAVAVVPEAPTSYACEVCNTIFTTNKSLKLHKRMHDPIKVRPIAPPENSDGPITNEIYHCEVCDKMIPYDYRDVHTASHAKGDNCSICNKKFTSKAYLEMHMNVHNMDKVPMNKQDKSLPYECLYCNRRFGRPHEKVKHERIHTGEKPHSCEICGKSFRVSYCLTLHMRTHTGARPYECPHCGKRFKAHSVYNHHLLTHSEVRAYKCPYCPKAFKTSVQLAGHKNSHTKPFSCQHCNRPFASLYAVRVHTETHGRQNNLKFSCTLCGASYARAFALKDHVKQVHKQDMETAENVVVNTNNEDWMARESAADTEEMSLNKELQEEITDLGMDTNELIIP